MESFFGSALSVVTSIGRIAGAVIDEFGLLHFGPTGSDSIQENIGQICFFMDSSLPEVGQGNQRPRLVVANQSTRDPATLFVPNVPAAAGGGDLIGTTQLTIPPLKKIQIGDAFHRYAEAGADQLIITPMAAAAPPGLGDGDLTTVRETKNDVPAEVNVQLGGYIKAQVKGSDRTVQVGIVAGLGSLVAVIAMKLWGAGDTLAEVWNIVTKAGLQGDDNTIVVGIPTGPNIEKGLKMIDITVSVRLQNIEQAPGLLPLSDADRDMLAAYRGP